MTLKALHSFPEQTHIGHGVGLGTASNVDGGTFAILMGFPPPRRHERAFSCHIISCGCQYGPNKYKKIQKNVKPSRGIIYVT
jgi:hypothetical protein